MKYSVLMSVYQKEKAQYLEDALESIFRQSVPSDDIVLVCDGPLTPSLEEVIRKMRLTYGDALRPVRLEKNMGLGNALNEGIRHCRHELIARMDSDDISYPDRCEKQLKVFSSMPEVSICSGVIEEFSEDPARTTSRRVLPQYHAEILQFAKSRNPFNHPCVMYRKSAVLTAGSYQDFYLLEDYYLWLRMLQNGCIGYNLQEPLLHMRAGSDMYLRRSGWRYAKSQRALFRYMKDHQMISRSRYLKSCLIRSCSSLAPNWLRKGMFHLFLRK